MKSRLLLFAVLSLMAVACMPGATVLYAQALPMPITVAWDANSVAEGVTGYEVSVDALAPVGVTGTTTTVTVNALGHHVIHVVAVNVVVTCDVSNQCSGGIITKSAPADLGFTVNPAATKVSNPKITKAGP